MFTNLCYTLVHAIEEHQELLRSGVVLVLLPRVAIVTAQNDQLPLLPTHGAKMGDLHYHRPEAVRHSETELNSQK